MHAGVPQISMKYPEYEMFNKEYEVAVLLEQLNGDSISEAINHLLEDTEKYQFIRKEALRARLEENWLGQKKILSEVYEKVMLKKKM